MTADDNMNVWAVLAVVGKVCLVVDVNVTFQDGLKLLDIPCIWVWFTNTGITALDCYAVNELEI